MRKLLLVADASWVQNLVRAAVPSSIEVEELNDPRQVVDRFREVEPDAVIVDLQIGSMGGMAVTRAIKSAAFTDLSMDVPIVMLLDRTADAFLARRAGADSWLVKPVAPADLRSALGIETTAVEGSS
ncbi:MAG: response regulator transcription factor [Acidimicrobiia bacterium]